MEYIPDTEYGQTYLLTFGIGQKLEILQRAGIRTPAANDGIITDFQHGLQEHVTKALPHTHVHAIPIPELEKQILETVRKHCTQTDNTEVVCISAEIGLNCVSCILDVNRIVNEKGEALGIGPRAMAAPIETQIEHIALKCKNGKVVLVEDGTFTGSTIAFLLHLLQKHSVSVNAIVAGIGFPDALASLRQNNAIFEVVEKIRNPLDWLPDHDFLPFMPGAGKLLGKYVNGIPHPSYDQEGDSYCIPYILPFAASPLMEKWTSIPETHTGPLSLFCLQKAEQLFSAIDRLNNSTIRMEHVRDIWPRVSIPLLPSGYRIPQVNFAISEFLHYVRTCTQELLTV